LDLVLILVGLAVIFGVLERFFKEPSIAASFDGDCLREAWLLCFKLDLDEVRRGENSGIF
jgi:hypothetical protein